MARNPIPFQQGLSLTAFLEQYGTEEQCRQAVFRMRWPEGFVCPRCGHGGFCLIRRHHRYQCNRCGHQTSLTVGTVFEQTKLPLRTGFLAMYRLTQTKQGISALQLSRELESTMACPGSQALPRPAEPLSRPSPEAAGGPASAVPLGEYDVG